MRERPRITLEELDGDEVVVRISATPDRPADGPRSRARCSRSSARRPRARTPEPRGPGPSGGRRAASPDGGSRARPDPAATTAPDRATGGRWIRRHRPLARSSPNSAVRRATQPFQSSRCANPCRQAASPGNSGVLQGRYPSAASVRRGLGPTRHQIGPAFPTALQGRFGARAPAIRRGPGGACSLSPPRWRRPPPPTAPSPPASARPTAARSSPRATRSSAARAPARRARTPRPARRRPTTTTSTWTTSTSTATVRRSTRAARRSRCRPASTVLFAGLYWAGDTSAGDDGSAAPLAAARSFVFLQSPTATRYSTISASVLDTDATSSTRYQGFADVTSQVAAAGNGVYTVGNVETGTGNDRYGGWGLVVVYRNAAEVRPASRSSTTGCLALQSGLRPTADISLSGFVTPPSGTVVGRLGILAWEGDRGITGDTATFAGRSLTDTLNPVTNVFNSTISRAGVATTGRTPSYVNQLGVDKDEFTIDGYLANNATTATLHLETATDLYLPGAIALAFDEGPPLATAAPTHLGHRPRRPDAQRRPRRLAGLDPDHLRLPVAPLRRGRRELHRHRGRHGSDLRARRRADAGSHDAGRRDRRRTRPARPRATSAQTATVAAGPAGQPDAAVDLRDDARRRDPDAPTRAPGRARRRSPTPTSGAAATRAARTAPTSPARPARPTRSTAADVGTARSASS